MVHTNKLDEHHIAWQGNRTWTTSFDWCENADGPSVHFDSRPDNSVKLTCSNTVAGLHRIQAIDQHPIHQGVRHDGHLVRSNTDEKSLCKLEIRSS